MRLFVPLQSLSHQGTFREGFSILRQEEKRERGGETFRNVWDWRDEEEEQWIVVVVDSWGERGEREEKRERRERERGRRERRESSVSSFPVE